MKIDRFQPHLQIPERENVSEFPVLKTQGLKSCEREWRKKGKGQGTSSSQQEVFNGYGVTKKQL